MLSSSKWANLVQSVLQFIDGDGSADPIHGSLPLSEVISIDNRSEVYALVRLPFSRHAVTDMIEVFTKIRLQLQYLQENRHLQSGDSMPHQSLRKEEEKCSDILTPKNICK